jgi:hypothetical protein
MKRPFFAPDFPAGGSRGFLAKGIKQKTPGRRRGYLCAGITRARFAFLIKLSQLP